MNMLLISLTNLQSQRYFRWNLNLYDSSTAVKYNNNTTRNCRARNNLNIKTQYSMFTLKIILYKIKIIYKSIQL